MYLHVSLWWQSRQRVKEAVARQGAPRSLAMATACPARGGQAGSPPCQDRSCQGMSRNQIGRTAPRPTPMSCPHLCSSHGMQLTPEPAPSCPTGEPFPFPAGAALAAAFCWPEPYPCVVLLTQGCPCPPHSRGQQSPPCPAESLTTAR